MDRNNYWGRLAARKYGRRAVLGSAAAAGGLALVGCGDDDDKPKATTAPAGATSAATSATGAASASASAAPTKVDLTKLSDADFFKALTDNPPKDWKDTDIKTGGRHVRLQNTVGSFDFHASTTSVTLEAVTPVYNRLLRLKAAEGMKSVVAPEFEGDLATKWERPDDTTMVFTLAPNIKFQNVAPVSGRALTIDDIKQSFERAKTFAGSQFKATLGLISAVEEVSPTQVRVKLSRPEPVMDYHLTNVGAGVFPKEILGDADALKSKMIGSGAFVMKSYTPNVEIVYDKNPDYWKSDAQSRKLPYFDGMNFQIIADLTALRTALDGGKADSYNTVAAVANFENIRDLNKRHPDWRIQFEQQTSISWVIGGHIPVAPWSDVRVRRAASLLFPRQKYLDAVARGYGNVGPYFPWPAIMDKAPTIDGMGPWMKYDPKQAKDLLSAAGNPEVTLEWFSLGDVQQIATLFQQEAAGIGWKVNLQQNADQVTHFTRLAQKSWKDLIIMGYPTDFIDPAATARAYIQGQPTSYMDLDDSVMNEAWKKLGTATGDARKAVGKEIWDRMLDQQFNVGIPRPNSITVWPGQTRNYVATSWSSTTGRGGGQLEAVWHQKA